MPIPKKKVVKKESHIEVNLSKNIITDDDFADLDLLLDDDEDLEPIRQNQTEDNKKPRKCKSK